MAIKSFEWNGHTMETLPAIRNVLVNIVDTEELAESFFEAYSECCPDAEHNIGYIIGTIPDKDVREDLLDLFMLDLRYDIPQHIFNWNVWGKVVV